MCFFRQLGQNMTNDRYTLAYFRLACKTSNHVVNVPKMLALKSSKRLSISVRVTPPPVVLLIRVRGSHILDLARVLPCEHMIYNITIL